MSIYVEVFVRAPMDALWAHTQTPALHEQWDLRFSRIEYLPSSRDSDPQRFRYTTRIGCGLEVRGEGETVGHRRLGDGSASSALKFASAEPVSLIREGSGYWKYIPTAEGVRFLTWYDYRTRFGAVGAVVDRLIFRPLIGWATPARRCRGFARSSRGAGAASTPTWSTATRAAGLSITSVRTSTWPWTSTCGSDDAGGLRLRSGAQRFYECVIGFSFPMLFSGIADVREWYDDAARRFRIEVDVHNRVWGPLFGYRGSFDVEWRTVSLGDVPGHVMPLRQERRD